MITFSQLGKMGRLCNQIWQLSVSICLANNNSDKYVFPQWEYETYFNLHNCFSQTVNVTQKYTEPHFHYTEIPFKNTKNMVLDMAGYFQSYRYLVGYEEAIRQLFTPLYTVEIENNATSIHVRRGDYLKFSDYHTVLGMDYYNRAMDLCPSNRYYVFSDDINWCKQNFKGNKFIFSEGNHETIDLAMMAKCSNNIIANSSFSWWGAWLNKNSSKKVISPINWFGRLAQHNIKDLIPTNWIQI